VLVSKSWLSQKARAPTPEANITEATLGFDVLEKHRDDGLEIPYLLTLLLSIVCLPDVEKAPLLEHRDDEAGGLHLTIAHSRAVDQRLPRGGHYRAPPRRVDVPQTQPYPRSREGFFVHLRAVALLVIVRGKPRPRLAPPSVGMSEGNARALSSGPDDARSLRGFAHLSVSKAKGGQIRGHMSSRIGYARVELRFGVVDALAHTPFATHR